mmetsp:Transcript_11925/g.16687  ORF Transcript_11925/g.16687 Transcript_11925/m.16687 type:complete len:255 (-) Transcript_11925:39-803(-)
MCSIHSEASSNLRLYLDCRDNLDQKVCVFLITSPDSLNFCGCEMLKLKIHPYKHATCYLLNCETSFSFPLISIQANCHPGKRLDNHSTSFHFHVSLSLHDSTMDCLESGDCFGYSLLFPVPAKAPESRLNGYGRKHTNHVIHVNNITTPSLLNHSRSCLLLKRNSRNVASHISLNCQRCFLLFINLALFQSQLLDYTCCDDSASHLLKTNNCIFAPTPFQASSPTTHNTLSNHDANQKHLVLKLCIIPSPHSLD